jgi:Origin of replication binding protein
LIVNGGAEAWQTAYDQAIPYQEWQLLQRLEGKLTYIPTIELNTADLSTLKLSQLPEQGIIALTSAKGTGKTKWIGECVQSSDRALLGGHRIALIRNLCHRLGIDYRGDLDKVQGQFISNHAYTLRVGTCVDSLLAIDPNRFAGCDLVLDELVQVLRHLLTSSTCRKDGKLAAILARFRELMGVARRVIVADADLDNASLDYLRELRQDQQPVFLIRNTFEPTGFPVQFIQSPDSAGITAQLLRDVMAGQRILLCTDSKMGSKTLNRLITQMQQVHGRVLLLNSETSGGEIERAFIESPDQHLDNWDVVIASPSMATGVSIESPYFTKVYGIFWGVSSTDADMAQALSRVREPVQRVVWCADRGSSFCPIGRTSNPLVLKAELKQRTDATVMLLRSQMREDTIATVERYDWQADPHLNLWSKIEAERNFSMMNLRAMLRVRLKHEGHQVQVEDWQSNAVLKSILRQTKTEIKEMEAQAIAQAKALTPVQVAELEGRDGHKPEDQRAIARFYLSEFYGTDDITSELVLDDNGGRRRAELINLETQLHGHLAGERDLRNIEKQAKWNQGICPWDLSNAELRRSVRAFLGLEEFLNPEREWVKDDLAPYAAKARQYAQQVKVALSNTISDEISDVQVIHQLLSQLGLKVKFRWSRSMPGHIGQKIRVYSLDGDRWQESVAILQRRARKRERLEELLTGSPAGDEPINHSKPVGDPVIVPIEAIKSRSKKEKSPAILPPQKAVVEQLILPFLTPIDKPPLANLAG